MSGQPRERAGALSHNDFSGSAGNVLQVGSFSGDVHVHSVAPVMAQPRQLPSAPEGFAGRAEYVALLDTLFRAKGREELPAAVVISAIGGTAGIGKTSLALYWAHRVANDFPDGQLYVNLRGFEPGSEPVRPDEALRGFLDALRIPVDTIPDGLADQAALFRSLLAQRRMLVVLDNARDADQVRLLLPGSSRCAVIVTSRRRLVGLAAREGAHLISLNIMNTEEATALLAARLGPERLAAEPDATARIIEQCSRLPLALAIVAARAAATPDFPLRVLADELSDEAQRLDALDTGDALADIRTVFSGSFRALSAPAASAFRLLGLHPGADIGLEAAAALTGHASARARTPFDELTRAYLLEEHTPGRYRCHDLLRLYARSLAGIDTAGARLAAMRRLLCWYRDRVSAAVAWLDFLIEERHPFATDADAQRWLAEERANLLAILGDPADPELDELMCEIAWLLSRFLHRRRHLDDWHHVLAAALQCARRAGNTVAVAQLQLQHALATATKNPTDPDSPRKIESALALLARDGTPADQATGLLHATTAYTVCGLIMAAQAIATEALTAWQIIDLPRAVAAAWTTMGNLRRRQLLFEEAMDCYQQAVVMWRAMADRWCEAETLMEMARADRMHSHLADAIKTIHEARTLYAELGDPGGEAGALNLLGGILLQFGRPNEAYEAQQIAYHILAGLGEQRAEPRGLVAVLAGLAASARERGQFDTCFEHLDEWAAAARELSDEEEEMRALGARGSVHQRRGDYFAAVTVLRESRERARRIRVEIEVVALVDLAVACFVKGNIEQARGCVRELVLLAGDRPDLDYLGDSERLLVHCVDYGILGIVQGSLKGMIEANRQLGDSGVECWQLDSLGRMFSWLGQYKDAVACHQQAIDIRSRMGADSYRRGWGLVGIAQAHQGVGRLDLTLDYFEQALALRQEDGNQYGVVQTRSYVALAHIARRDFAQARVQVDEIGAMLDAGQNDAAVAVGEVMPWLADAYTEQCRFAEAEACYQRAAGYLRSHGSVDVQRNLNRIAAGLRLREGRGEEAVTMLKAELENRHLAAQISIYAELVVALRRQRRLSEAEDAAHQGFRAADQSDSDVDRGRFLQLLAEVLRAQERFDEACQHLSSALDLCRGNGDRTEANVLADLGRAYLEAGQVDRAVSCCQESLAIRRHSQDARVITLASAELAYAYASAGRRVEAEELLSESVTLAAELEDLGRVASIFGECARVAQALGHPERVEEYFLHQARLGADSMDLRATAKALSDLGEYLLTVDRLDHAVDCHGRSLTTWRQLGDPRGTLGQLHLLGRAQARLGRQDEAVESLRKSLALAREMNDRAQEADTIRVLARIAPDHTDPLGDHEHCLATYEQLGDLHAARETADEIHAMKAACDAPGK